MAATMSYPSSANSHVSSHVQQQNLSTNSTQQASPHQAHSVYADFNYYPQDSPVPEPLNVTKPGSFLKEAKDTRRMFVQDIRGNEDSFSLDKNGFEVVKHLTEEKDFLDDDQIEKTYYPEIEELVKQVTGASVAQIYDHTLRREADNSQAASFSAVKAKTKRQQGPNRRVHVDQSYDFAREVVQREMPQQAEHLLQGRFQIINVWRPIKPIYRDPLGVVDAHTCSKDDLVPVQIIYPNSTAESFVVRPGAEEGEERHKWHYLYGQQPEELLFFKIFDSKADGRARSVPHSAFSNAEEIDKAPRESIEVRCLVFHPDDRT